MDDKSSSKQSWSQIQFPDPIELSRIMTEIAEHSHKLVQEFLSRMPETESTSDMLDIGGAFLEMTQQMMVNPAKLLEAQLELWQNHMILWRNTTLRTLGKEAEPIISLPAQEHRFRDSAWEENQLFDFIKQSYLLTARYWRSVIVNTERLDKNTAQKIDFYTKQFLDAMPTSNFIMTNPEVLRAIFDSNGTNLIDGLCNMLEDIEKRYDQLYSNKHDTNIFMVGKNLATSKGKVIFQNDLMQLIQYAPLTEKVYQIPILVIPPWINKYYILDLEEKNSFVHWAVSQGFTVFMISWVNPDKNLADKSFSDYMDLGPLSALTAIEQAIGEQQVNMVGYCLGGTLLSVTLAYMAQKGDQRVASASFLNSMVDFENAGALSVFIDEEQLRVFEHYTVDQVSLAGRAITRIFDMLRANDLIWSFVINNYGFGSDPFPFDLLYWNADSTRIPAAMHRYYLQNCYQKNRLVESGGMQMHNVPIDLRIIDVPVCLISAREDHIVPWKSNYAAVNLYQGPIEFILVGAGHVAGIVNPPTTEKHKAYGHWVNKTCPSDPEQWLISAEQRDNSWWISWSQWLIPHCGPQVSARQPGAGNLAPLEEAPGSYVLGC